MNAKDAEDAETKARESGSRALLFAPSRLNRAADERVRKEGRKKSDEAELVQPSRPVSMSET